MDAFDFVEVKETPRSKISFDLIWNILTIMVLICAMLVAGIFLVIFTNPQVAINPFPPPTLVTPITYPTSTPPGLKLEPTWTPTAAGPSTATNTPLPTFTPFPTDTPVTGPVSPSVTPGGMSFVVQQGSPQAIPSTIYDPAAGCNWMGVGGQAVDLSNAPYIYGIVQMGGTLQGQLIETKLSMTGTASQLGKGGFVFQISDHPVASNGTLWIQLLDQQGLPLSDKVYFDTYEACDKNLIVIYFKQVK